MTKLELTFYTIKEQEPPIEKPLLCFTKYDSYEVLEYMDDSDYGKVFSGFENYTNADTIIKYAVLPTD